MRKETAVLILSCDKYADVWKSFFSLFWKFWPDCPYNVYLGTNELDFHFPSVTVIKSGSAMDWSRDTRSILEQMEEDYIILLLEDYFLTANVDFSLLSKCLNEVQMRNAAFMRIASFRHDHFSTYAYDLIQGNEFCGVTRISAPYRISLQAGIWNKKELLGLLQDGESPWKFEINGSERTRTSGKLFLGLKDDPKQSYVHGPISYLCTAITKGTWMREAIELCKKENAPIEISARPVESRFAYVRRKVYHRLPFWTRKYIDFISGKLSPTQKNQA